MQQQLRQGPVREASLEGAKIDHCQRTFNRTGSMRMLQRIDKELLHLLLEAAWTVLSYTLLQHRVLAHFLVLIGSAVFTSTVESQAIGRGHPRHLEDLWPLRQSSAA